MLRKALKEICKISSDETINTENYLNSINFIDHLYHTVSILKQDISVKKISFYPSFKSRMICERLGLPSEPEENELKLIKVASDLFRVDKDLTNRIKENMEELCKEIILIDNIFIFKLK